MYLDHRFGPVARSSVVSAREPYQMIALCDYPVVSKHGMNITIHSPPRSVGDDLDDVLQLPGPVSDSLFMASEM